jgi:hypothetical protein
MAAVTSEPRRRDHLPEAMSEGARQAQSKAPVWLESLGRLFAKANAAAERRGARRRGDLKSYEPSFVPRRHSSV